MAFDDLTKAFKTVSREGLWKIMAKYGCPDKFIGIVRNLHDGMMASVRDQQELSDPFPITNGVKQGCILAPTLFIMVFSAMMRDSFQNYNTGINFIYRFDCGYSICAGCKPKLEWRKSLFENFCLLMTVLWLLAQIKTYRTVWTTSPQLATTSF